MLVNVVLFGETKSTVSHAMVYNVVESYHHMELGCIASNEKIAEETGLKGSTVAKILSQLNKAGWIKVVMKSKTERKQILPLMIVTKIPKNEVMDDAKSIDSLYSGVKPPLPQSKDIGQGIEQGIGIDKSIPIVANKKFTTQDEELVNLLFKLMYENKPELGEKIPKESDYNEMRKMRTIDKRDPEAIRAVIIWSQQDNFWWKNIRSVHKLRIQYEKLYINAESWFKEKKRNKIVSI